MSTVSDGKVVAFHYTLTNAEGETIDSSRERGEPMPYLHGAQNIVPGLERQMAGKVVGDAFKAEVSPEEGYGPKDDTLVGQIPRKAFPEDADVFVGATFMAQTPQGPVPINVIGVEGDNVTIDQNHPLAGQTLYFDVEITEIRDASDEEMAHGHPHGPDGHHH